MHGPSGSDIGVASILLSIIAMGLALVAIASGGGLTSPVSLKQSGTFTATWSTATMTVVIGTVTFSPAFTAKPSISITPRTFPNIKINSITGNIEFFTASTTWLNMPAANTEIFGDTTGQHQFVVDLSTGVSAASMQVNCQTASTGASAVIRPEYSLDAVNWFELAQFTGALDTGVGGQVACPNIQGNFNQATLATAAVGNQIVFIRLVGIGGGGIGDNPIFASATLFLYSGFQVQGSCTKNLDNTLTLFTWRCVVPSPFGALAPQSVTVDWQAEVK